MRISDWSSDVCSSYLQVPALVRRLIDAGAAWRGFHIFAGSQALDAGAIADTQAQTVALAARLANEIGAPPPLVNLGGGMGVPYFPGDTAVDTAAVGDALGETLGARVPGRVRSAAPGSPAPGRDRDDRRSEEHTSELQSLMRKSYAVFC